MLKKMMGRCIILIFFLVSRQVDDHCNSYERNLPYTWVLMIQSESMSTNPLFITSIVYPPAEAAFFTSSHFFFGTLRRAKVKVKLSTITYAYYKVFGWNNGLKTTSRCFFKKT